MGQGGLWAMMKNAQASFERTEHYFRAVTSEAHLHKIDSTSVISGSVRDVDVVSAYMQLSVILFWTDGPQWCCQRCTSQHYTVVCKTAFIFLLQRTLLKTQDEIKRAEIKNTSKGYRQSLKRNHDQDRHI